MIRRVRHIHFVGIGGCGMSGIAEILRSSGYVVSGSDAAATPVTRRLARRKIRVFRGHAPEHVEGADLLVYSSAVPADNPERLEAERRHIPVLRRADMLGQLMRMKFSVAVAGTHGKTTTTSMTGDVLAAGGLHPTIIVGGIVRREGSGARLGKGPYLVVEADEFDRSFLRMPPTVAIMTTLETEHLDCYRDLDDIKDAFVGFASQVPFFGCILLCLDEPTLRDLMPRLSKNVVLTYGFSAGADYRAVDRVFTAHGTRFGVEYRGKRLGEIELSVPGDHNVRNAMAAAASGLEMRIPFRAVARALRRFEGIHRRFEIKGEKRGVLVVDDYAHHPTEIRATLKAAKDTYHRRVIAIFQPHLYSRTRDFYREFGEAFADADRLIVTEIYAAREKPIDGVSGQMVADAAVAAGHPSVKFMAVRDAIADEVLVHADEGDLVVTLGAGDIWKVGETLLKKL